MKFVENFKSVKDITDSYHGGAEDLKGAVIHLAWYGYGSYCGSSLVIYEKTGKLYEVNGSHCSCNGLEGQWSPEETSWSALAMRNVQGECDGSGEAQKILARLVKRHMKGETVGA
jgi:hypothetical protein